MCKNRNCEYWFGTYWGLLGYCSRYEMKEIKNYF